LASEPAAGVRSDALDRVDRQRQHPAVGCPFVAVNPASTSSSARVGRGFGRRGRAWVAEVLEDVNYHRLGRFSGDSPWKSVETLLPSG
jgi:hypothetical protein